MTLLIYNSLISPTRSFWRKKSFDGQYLTRVVFPLDIVVSLSLLSSNFNAQSPSPPISHSPNFASWLRISKSLIRKSQGTTNLVSLAHTSTMLFSSFDWLLIFCSSSRILRLYYVFDLCLFVNTWRSVGFEVFLVKVCFFLGARIDSLEMICLKCYNL